MQQADTIDAPTVIEQPTARRGTWLTPKRVTGVLLLSLAVLVVVLSVLSMRCRWNSMNSSYPIDYGMHCE